MALNTAESLAEKQRGIKVGSRVCALQSGKYTLERGTVTADEGMSWRIKFDRYDEISVPKSKVARVDNSCSRNAVVAKALNACTRNAGRVVSNGIGDCYSDGVYFLEKAYKVAGTPAKAKGLVRQARESVSYVAKYDYADADDKATMSKCLADIDKAASSPTEDTIKEARWTCEKARAKADGGSPRRTFWNACGAVRNTVVANALNGCGTARNAWGDETQVNGLITKMLGLINKIKPIAQQLYDTAFDLDDAGSVWLGRNNGSKNAQKVKIAVERANKIMKRLSNFTSGLD